MARKKQLTSEDMDVLEERLSKVDIPDKSHMKQQYKEILLDRYPLNDLSCIKMALDLSDVWKPGSARYDPEAFDDPDRLGRAAIEIAALNSDIARKRAYLEALEEEQKVDLEVLRASLTKEIRDVNRQGMLKGAFTEKELVDLVKSSEKYIEAFTQYCAIRELCSEVKAIYFSLHRLEEMLNNRVKTLVSEWGRSTRYSRN